MKVTVNFEDFRDAFISFGKGNEFTYEGLKMLFDYLEEYEEETNEEMELDVIAICSEFVEEDVEDVAHDYDIDISECKNDDEVKEVVKDYLEYNTLVIGFSTKNNIIYQNF